MSPAVEFAGTVLCPRDGRPGALPRRRTRRTHRPFADVAVHRDGTLGLSTRSQAVLWSIPWSDSIAGSVPWRYQMLAALFSFRLHLTC